MDQAQQTYAGFWMRFLAYIIDAIVLGIVSFIILIPFLGIVGLTAATSASDLENGGGGMIAAMIGTYFLTILMMTAASWLYYALMESSAKQATLGKLALSLKVTDMAGSRISFGRATGRYFGKLVSGLILMIGYIMAGFTQQKQALHDIMAGTLVVRK